MTIGNKKKNAIEVYADEFGAQEFSYGLLRVDVLRKHELHFGSETKGFTHLWVYFCPAD